MCVPFNKPHLTGKEVHYVEQALKNGHFSGDGEFTKKCTALIQELMDCKRAILTTSCTHALEMAALLLDIQPGDEVIVPSFTFVSTINAFVLRGAKPVFADIRPDTLNMDERQLAELITEKTRAIVPIHYGGIACEMDSILSIANSNKVPVVEDNAHGFGAKYKDRYLGTLGCLASQSFHETKNLSCGEGGALIVNQHEFVERAEIIRDKGTDRNRFFRGEVDKYTWVSVGSSYAIADVLAAFLLAQIEEFVSIQERREEIWNYYNQSLQFLNKSNDIRLPTVPEDCIQSYHLFYVITANQQERTELLEYLNAHGVNAVFHYVPLHLSEMGSRLGGRPGQCRVAEDISERLVRLPFFNSMKRDQQDKVIDEVIKFYERR